MINALPRIALTLVSIVIALEFSNPCAGAAVLLHYQMGQAQPQIEDAANTADGGSLTNAGGFGAFDLVANDGYASQPVLHVNPTAIGVAGSASVAFTDGAYFYFTLTVGTNVADLDLTSLTFNIAKGGSSNPRGYGVRADTPTTADEILRASTTITNTRPNFLAVSIDLSPFSSLQNLTAGQVITFEIAGFTPSTGSSLEFDDIIVNGDLLLIPEPSTSAFMALVALTLLVRRCRLGKGWIRAAPAVA